MTKNKIMAIILIIIGATFLFTAATFWIDKLTSIGSMGLMETWRGWLEALAGFVAAVTGLIILFRKDKNGSKTEVKAETYISKQEIDHPVNVDIKTETKNIINNGSPQFAMGEKARNIQAPIYIENLKIDSPEDTPSPDKIQQFIPPPAELTHRKQKKI